MEKDNTEEIKELVIARLQTLPDSKGISIGSFGEFTKEQLIERVQSGDEVGEKIIQVEMNFLRALKDGILYEKELTVSN